MRDGVELALDLLLPGERGPHPVVLLRTPYDKVANRAGSELARLLGSRGYAVAFSDCRGRFNSGGVFRPYFDEADDGYDTVEWIAAQEWCNDNVGMLGGSYAAETTWYAASRRPPHLKAIAPFSAGPGTLWHNEPIFGGCFELPMAEWMVGLGDRSWQDADFGELWTRHQPYYEAPNLALVPNHAGVESAWWNTWMEHPAFDDFWKAGSYDNYTDMDVAAVNVTGWWDSNGPGGPANFEGLRRGHRARDQRLIIGPWPHWVNRKRVLSGVDFGEHAIIELYRYVVRFFDRWLKGVDNGIEHEKPVYVFVTGANEWWAEDDWPLPGTEYVPYYLHSRGHANSLRGDGALSSSPPAKEPADHFDYDPRDPIRVLWNMHEGPVDDRVPSLRDDCLCYTSDLLRAPLDVVGCLRCFLYASSSALDTDWHVRLVDVHPDGNARFICRGALRARFRNGLDIPELLKPNTPTFFEVVMDPCGVRFLPGHRIRVEVTSSWFTQYDRNMNTGAENFFKDTSEPVVAHQQIFHESGLASCVHLPVINR
jgi:putative CocE/NonD family hydrolase